MVCFVFWKRVVKLASKNVLAAGLGFSGGVMLYVSFVEIFGKSVEAFEAAHEKREATWLATVCFFAGMLILRLMSFLVHQLDKHHGHSCQGEEINKQPDQQQRKDDNQISETGVSQEDTQAARENETDHKQETAEKKAKSDDEKLQKMGLNTALAIALHNFPEGLATFVATLADASVGVTLAIAIAIHNIPEGLCVALPIFYSTGSKVKGFGWALLSGLSEPVGAFVGWAIIKATGDDMNQTVYGVLFGIVAGMMVMIVLLELLPTATRYDPKDTVVTTGLVCGMLVMALSLCIFIA